MKTFKRSPGIHFAEADNEFYLTLESRDVVVCLNESAFAVLQNLDGFKSSESVSNELAKRANLPPAQVRPAVDELIGTLTGLGVLTEVEQGGTGKKARVSFRMLLGKAAIPEISQVWKGAELAGGVFLSSDDDDGDPHVIVPDVTDGPITTCPPQTCTVPAGFITKHRVIRIFDEKWRKDFENFRISSSVHYQTRRA